MSYVVENFLLDKYFMFNDTVMTLVMYYNYRNVRL